MRHIILTLALSVFLLSCGQNETNQKVQELKDRELAMKEKELELQRKDSNLTVAPSSSNNQTTNNNSDFPFVGTKTFCIKKGSDESTGSLSVNITNDGMISYKGTLKDNGMCEDGCDLSYKGKLNGFKANSGDGKISFSDSNTFHWEGEEDSFTASLCLSNKTIQSTSSSFIGTWISENGEEKLIIKKITGDTYDVKCVYAAGIATGTVDPTGSATVINGKLVMDDGWGKIVFTNGRLYCAGTYYNKK